MVKVLFVCLGNICRSPMAESIMTHLVKKRGLEGNIVVSSAAACRDALGSSPHHGTQEKLAREGVPLVPHRARLLTRSDGAEYDFLVGMDEANVRDMKRILGAEYGKKVCMLLDFTAHSREIADPWFTGNFDKTYTDILEGCKALLDEIVRREGWRE